MGSTKYPLLKNIKIIDAGAEGKAIVRVDGRVIFVHGAVPDDVVDIQITKKKKSFWEGRPIHFHRYSEKRIEPICEHFGTCGGCKWQMLNYKEQLYYKQKQVIDNLERLGKIELPEINPIIPSDKTEYYRNKLEFTFSNNRWLTNEEIKNNRSIIDKNALGFHLPGRHDKLLDIKHCYLQPEPSNAIRLAVKEYAQKHQLSFFDLKKKEGFLRNLIIRTASTGEVMVIISFCTDNKKQRENLLEFIGNQFPEITALMYVINNKGNDTINDLDIHCFKGNNFIFEVMEGLKFKIGPKSFYQTNSRQAYHLYKVVRNFAQLTGKEIVYDLYTGTGTIANFIAKDAHKIIGIEYLSESIKDAKMNAQINRITNTFFFAGDIKDVLKEAFIEQQGKPNIIITDPPRIGMHTKVVQKILEILPEKMVYVSCNPATQARDIALLSGNYQVTKVQPIDMFPHTQHVENVVLLELICNN